MCISFASCEILLLCFVKYCYAAGALALLFSQDASEMHISLFFFNLWLPCCVVDFIDFTRCKRDTYFWMLYCKKLSSHWGVGFYWFHKMQVRCIFLMLFCKILTSRWGVGFIDFTRCKRYAHFLVILSIFGCHIGTLVSIDFTKCKRYSHFLDILSIFGRHVGTFVLLISQNASDMHNFLLFF